MPSPSKDAFDSGNSYPFGEPMPISHELSSEIATALFTGREKSPRELNDLKKMVLEIHSTLEGLTEKRHEKPAKTHAEAPPVD